MGRSDLPLEPWPRRLSAPAPQTNIAQALVTTAAIAHATDRIVTARILSNIARENRLSISGKMAALTERAKDFNAKTETVLDGIAEKIAEAEAKRDAAAGKHHGYYDGVISGIDESIEAIDRLSNGPLSQGGEG